MTKFNKKMICCFMVLTLIACDSQAAQAYTSLELAPSDATKSVE